MKLDHTPGPWTVAKFRLNPGEPPTSDEIKSMLCESIDRTIEHGDSVTDFYLVMSSLDPDDPTYSAIAGNGPHSESNARLIAAAPEMLEWMIAYLRSEYSEHLDLDKIDNNLINIIERATGKTIEEVMMCAFGLFDNYL